MRVTGSFEHISGVLLGSLGVVSLTGLYSHPDDNTLSVDTETFSFINCAGSAHLKICPM